MTDPDDELERLLASAPRLDEALIRLLHRMQTGWQPRGDEIDPAVPQRDLFDWEFAPAFERPEAVVIGYDADRRVTRSDQIVWIDAGLRWSLCEGRLLVAARRAV